MTGAAQTLLVAEDDVDLRTMLTELLVDEGYEVEAVRDGQAALHRALAGRHDLLLLDRGLPVVDGLDLLMRLRRVGWTVPVLVLSAYGSATDRVTGLDAGAEDYLVKPFDVEELLARVRALLRRHLDAAQLLPVPGGRLDPQARLVRSDVGQTLLSPRETALLQMLAAEPRRIFPRDEICRRVFCDADSDTVVDTYVHYLRRKLGRGVIRTVRGLGYRIGADETVSVREPST